MYYFHNEFIGTSHQNYSVDSWGHNYSYNENGHRSPSIDSIDKNNYILFAGCSHTQGIGLPLEETYFHITSKLLGMDYYNLGVGGSGCDTMFYNVFMFLHKYEHKPKLLVLQWPFYLRYTHKSNECENCIGMQGSWSKDKFLDFILLGDRIGYFSLRSQLYKSLFNQIKIPIINISCPDHITPLDHYVKFTSIDRAYDEQHNGPKSHKLLSELILKECQQNPDKYLNVITDSTIRGQSD